jgi:hypothetical protein
MLKYVIMSVIGVLGTWGTPVPNFLDDVTNPDMPPDLNHDGIIDQQDSNIVLRWWGDMEGDEPCWVDINRDGVVGTYELKAIEDNWTTAVEFTLEELAEMLDYSGDVKIMLTVQEYRRLLAATEGQGM